jgi:electron transfer flavoprotein alpha subunit
MTNQSNSRDVWVFIEQEEGVIADVSLELLAKAQELAGTLDSQVCGLMCGYQVGALAETVIHHGADRVLWADHPELEMYRTLPYAKVTTELVQEQQPYILIFGATAIGRDLAPRVASASRAGLTADCTDLQIGDYTSKKDKRTYNDLLLQIRPAFGGNIIATIINPKMHPQMATVREGVMRRQEPTRESEINLKDSPIIVSGGGGVDSEESFELVRELAHVLGGEVGASRAAVDAGLVSREHQVGQTGTTVRPRLYIAAGISGAVQHRAGMDESAKIIAINTDPNAPIFEIAHYKIIGDLTEVIPMMIRALREKAK